jgi:hypothetical protein
MTCVMAPACAAETPTRTSAALAPVALLARTPPTRTVFAEARFSPLLDRPLLVYGQLSWEGGDRLERHVDSPYVETTRIADGEVTMHRSGHATRHFSLDRAPSLKALLDSLVAVLSGDTTRLRTMFHSQLERHGTDSGWSLILTPKSARLARSLGRIGLYGDRDNLHCIMISEAQGTESIDLLGPLAARMPAKPTREALSALCRQAD